eukprot:TRINITY_DN56084_c0_g1_i1.p1 TRINITY_DN56084_c0_g1~~TRINITY_DN56084_c0_g1_i1.p1  ORF type:complete len:532 (+),score=74.45 TRINITY_DN56084_c0_g1_i1:273-1868(+)
MTWSKAGSVCSNVLSGIAAVWVAVFASSIFTSSILKSRATASTAAPRETRGGSPPLPPSEQKDALPAESGAGTASSLHAAAATVGSSPIDHGLQRSCLLQRLGINEAPAEWCFYTGQKPCRFAGYPLSADMVETDGLLLGDTSRMSPFLEKLSTGKAINVVEFGGSFSMGEGCEQPQRRHGQACAWPARTQDWLNQAFPGAKFRWWKKSRRATTSSSFLTGLGALVNSLPEKPDLVFIELLMNDARQALQASHFVNASLDDLKRGAFESLVRATHEALPGAQLVVITGACPGCFERSHIHTDVAKHYGLTVVDYARMAFKHNKLGNTSSEAPDWLWPQQGGNAKEAGVKWPGFMPEYLTQGKRHMVPHHPPWPVHVKVMQVIAYTLLKMLHKQCLAPSSQRAFWPPTSLTPQPILSVFPSCLQPATFISAAASFANTTKEADVQPVVKSGNWRLFEDRVGKPGWIASEAGSTIKFPIKVDPHGEKDAHTVTISWLTSYTSFILEIVFPGAATSEEGRAAGCKFKVIEVTAC